MSTGTSTGTASGIKTVIHPVKDLDRAKALFAALLGSDPVMDEPYYVQFVAGDLEVGLDPNGHAHGMTGPVTYWHVDDVERAVTVLVAAGAGEGQKVRDVGGGRRTATVTDADGTTIGLIQTA